jgi:two-component system response regulator YesN
VILPVSADEPQNTVPDKVVESCSLIMKNVRRYYDIQLLMGLSSVGKMSDIFRLIAESKTALNQCFFSEKNSVITYSRNLLELQGNPPHISYTKLFEMIDMNKKEAMLEYIQNIFRELRKLKNYTYVHDAFIDFLSIGKLIREKYKIQERASLSESKFNYDTFYDIGFIADVEFYVYDIYLSLFMGKQDGEISYSYVVKKCIAFIHTNYCENITLAEVAKAAGVSHGYLSFIFKQETGINFNTYLSQYRVKEAKKLLLSTNMRIYEVAEKVGFSNPYYFSKVFKEFTGITCKEFKDKRSSIEY